MFYGRLFCKRFILIAIHIASIKALSMGKRKTSQTAISETKKLFVQQASRQSPTDSSAFSRFLLKTEPDVFGIDHLAGLKDQVSIWDGVRNSQARNILKEMNVGDQAFFYHSSCGKATGIYGTVEIVREAFFDPSQSDHSSKYFDAKATGSWVSVDVKLLEKWEKPVLLTSIKEAAPLAKMMLLKNSRLSVQRVTPEEWDNILAMRQ